MPLENLTNCTISVLQTNFFTLHNRPLRHTSILCVSFFSLYLVINTWYGTNKFGNKLIELLSIIPFTCGKLEINNVHGTFERSKSTRSSIFNNLVAHILIPQHYTKHLSVNKMETNSKWYLNEKRIYKQRFYWATECMDVL